MPIPTPHINAQKDQIAKTVLMPGDPLRAKFIAETFLTDPVLVNNVRGVQGHTGTWKGVPVTVMASGMGIPSIGIYSWELFNFYDVDNIIRIGSAGALQDDLKLRDLVAGQAACTNSNYVKSFGLGETATFAPIADYTLLSTAVSCAKARGIHAAEHRRLLREGERHRYARRKHSLFRPLLRRRRLLKERPVEADGRPRR